MLHDSAPRFVVSVRSSVRPPVDLSVTLLFVLFLWSLTRGTGVNCLTSLKMPHWLSHRRYSSPSSSSFLFIIVVVPLHHCRRSSPSLSDTRHPSSKRLGRGSNAKASRNSEIVRTNGQMDGCTDSLGGGDKSQTSDVGSQYRCRRVGTERFST